MSATNAVASRRSFLAAAAVSTAILSPSVAGAATSPDAELIRLGQQLDDLIRRIEISTARREPLWDEHRRLMDEWYKANRTFAPGANTAEHRRLLTVVGMASVEAEDADDLCLEISKLTEAVLAIPSATVLGLCVKARAAKFAASHYWNESEADTDWDRFAMRKLCDAVIEMCARTMPLAAAQPQGDAA